MLVSPAYAQSAGGLGGLETFLPLILIFVVFYFLLIRPQQRKAKTHREMIGNLRRGDRIATSGGLIGLITRVPNDTELILEVTEGVKVRVVRSMVADLLAKSQPVRDRGGDNDDDDTEWDDDEGDDEETAERPPPRRRKRSSARSSQQRTEDGNGEMSPAEADEPEPVDDRPKE